MGEPAVPICHAMETDEKTPVPDVDSCNASAVVLIRCYGFPCNSGNSRGYGNGHPGRRNGNYDSDLHPAAGGWRPPSLPDVAAAHLHWAGTHLPISQQPMDLELPWFKHRSTMPPDVWLSVECGFVALLARSFRS